MIYNESDEYEVKFYVDLKGNNPVLEYLKDLNEKERAKVLKYIEFLRIHKGILDEPYSKHIAGKIRELRVDFAKNRHRVFYFTFVGRSIILLSAFLKKTAKMPVSEIKKAEEIYHNVLNNRKFYE